MTLRARVVRWRIAPRGAARGRTVRESVIVDVTHDGVVGYGEAAPLAAGDSIATVLRALDDPRVFSPSAKFALETAELDAKAKARGISVAQVLGATCDSIRNAVVVDTVEDALATSARTLKIKVGGDGAPDLVRIRAIAAARPDATLRLDANRSWPRHSVRERILALADLPIEFIEEPCIDSHALLDDDLPLRIALDESLVEHPVVAGKQLAAIILKPTLLGGIAACRDLAARARENGVKAIVTHALEGPVGMAACAALGLAVASDVRSRIQHVDLGGDVAMGLAPHPALDAWDVERAGPTGLGLDIDALEDAIIALADPLSLGARRQRSRGPSTSREPSTSRGPSTSRERCIVATPTHETIAAIRDALDARRPIALLHPRVPDAERDRQRALVEQACLDEGEVVLFTSGSTGSARGVVLSREALVAATEASASHLGWRDDDRWLLALPMAHAGGLAVVVRCFAAKRDVILVEDQRGLADGLAQCTLASLVPTQLGSLLDDPAWRPPAQLRAVLLGGAAASPALLAAAAERGVPFLATYGMTETFGQVATAPLARAGEVDAPLVPLSHVTLAAGTRDEPRPIRIRGASLARRYLDGEAIAPELVTRDLGYVEHGLRIVGRADDMIITGGENVYPQLVEDVLVATPGVRAACAFGIADDRWGQRVVAALAVDPSFELARAVAHWHAALPAHALPREVATVRELPVSPNGKLDRRAASQLPRSRV